MILSKTENIRIARCNTAGCSTEEIGPCDLVIVAVQNYFQCGLAAAHRAIVRRAREDPDLQNGLGNEEFLAQNLVRSGFWRDCFICLDRAEPGVVERFDYGRLTIGEFHGDFSPGCTIAGNLNGAG